MFKKKSIFVVICIFFNCLFSLFASFESERYGDLRWNYLHPIAENLNNKKEALKIDCSINEELEKLLLFLVNNKFIFDKYSFISCLEWWLCYDNFKYLKTLSMQSPINDKMRILYPYANDIYSKKWKWTFFSCLNENYFFQSWIFEATWIVVEYPDSEKKWYNRTYFKIIKTSDQNIDKYPLLSWDLLFIECSSNDSKWGHRIWKINREVTNWFIRYFSSWWYSIAWESLSSMIWKKLYIRFYLNPWIILLEKDIPCENSWMLWYKIFEDLVDW